MKHTRWGRSGIRGEDLRRRPATPVARARDGWLALRRLTCTPWSVVGEGVSAGGAALGAAVVLTLLPEGWRAPRTDLEARLAALESRPQGLAPGALQAALAPLEQRLSALESTPAPAPAPAPDLSAVEARLGALETRATPNDPADAIAALGQRIDALQADVVQQARSAVETALAQSRAEVQAQAAALTSREQDVAAQQARVARRAAITDLVAAAESGAPAAQALAALGGDDATGGGSNNWALAPGRATTGRPIQSWTRCPSVVARPALA